MKKIIFSTFILFQSVFINSQVKQKKIVDAFEPAYIITLKGDTIKGSVKIPKAHTAEMYQKINFKDTKNKLRLYTPDKILGYGYANYYYVSAFRDNKSCYFKVLCKGKATLLSILLEFNDEGIISEVQDFCVLTQGKETDMKVLDEKNVKKQLKEAFKANKELVKKIADLKEISYNAETLEVFFKEFNEE